jgi:hypothetical protein
MADSTDMNATPNFAHATTAGRASGVFGVGCGVGLVFLAGFRLVVSGLAVGVA